MGKEVMFVSKLTQNPAEYHREYRKLHPEKNAQNCRRWREQHPEAYQQQKERQKQKREEERRRQQEEQRRLQMPQRRNRILGTLAAVLAVSLLIILIVK